MPQTRPRFLTFSNFLKHVSNSTEISNARQKKLYKLQFLNNTTSHTFSFILSNNIFYFYFLTSFLDESHFTNNSLIFFLNFCILLTLLKFVLSPKILFL